MPHSWPPPPPTCALARQRARSSLLITGDEEGPATDGTKPVLDWMAQHGQIPDFCLVGEPTNPRVLGEMIKIGRRGSLNATIRVQGTQGHAAYPHRADNPVHPLIAMLADLTAARLDDGTDSFEPSSLQVTTIDVGNMASNVIPGQARASLNIRFNDKHTWGLALGMAAPRCGVPQRARRSGHPYQRRGLQDRYHRIFPHAWPQ